MINPTQIAQSIDQATIDYYVAKGRRARSRAFAEMVRSIFSIPETKPEIARGVANCG